MSIAKLGIMFINGNAKNEWYCRVDDYTHAHGILHKKEQIECLSAVWTEHSGLKHFSHIVFIHVADAFIQNDLEEINKTKHRGVKGND